MARTRGALQPAAPRITRPRAPGAYDSRFANSNISVFIIIVLIIITFVVASARMSLRMSSMCGDNFSSNSMCRESSKTKEQRRFSACYTRRQAQPCLNLLTLTPCRARRVADGRESTAGTPRCALSGPTKRPVDRTLTGTAGIETPRTLACTGSLNVPHMCWK